MSFLQAAMNIIAFMVSGTAADAVKPMGPVTLEACNVDWLRVSDSHDVPGQIYRMPTNRTNTRLQPLSALSMDRDRNQPPRCA